MTKTSKSERKWGKNSQKNIKQDVEEVPDRSKYKILIENCAFSKAMSYDDCVRTMDEMEAKARKLRRPLPSLMLVKQ